MKTITVPSGLIEALVNRNLNVPAEIEMRRKGKGRQYVYDAADPALPIAIGYAGELAQDKNSPDHWAAVNFLRSLEKQGVSTGVELPARSARRKVSIVTNLTLGHNFGKYAGRRLVVEVDANGVITTRAHGTRQVESVMADLVYGLSVRSRANRAALEKARAKKAAKAARREARKLARKGGGQ